MAYRRYHAMDTKIVRIFNTARGCGSGQACVPNFIHQALRNQPLTVYGTGEQTGLFVFTRT